MAKPTKTPASAPAAAKEEPKTNTATVQPYDWSQAESTGFENVSQRDLGIPFLTILQSNSPQVNRADKNYATKKIDGAQAGDIINTVTNSVVCAVDDETPLEFIPCSYERLFVEWKPRNEGGGFVKAHRDERILGECTRDENNKDVLKNGNLIVNTAYFYGIALIDGEKVQAVIGFSSTQLKKARQWLQRMQSIKFDGPKGRFTPPMFSHAYGLTSVVESNADGSWFGWKIEMVRALQDAALIGEAAQVAKLATQASQKAIAAAGDEPY